MSRPTSVYTVDVTFRKTVRLRVLADSEEDARSIAGLAAPDVEVVECPGSEMDGWDVQDRVFDPIELQALATDEPDAWVWREHRTRVGAVCDEASLLLEEWA